MSRNQFDCVSCFLSGVDWSLTSGQVKSICTPFPQDSDSDDAFFKKYKAPWQLECGPGFQTWIFQTGQAVQEVLH